MDVIIGGAGADSLVGDACDLLSYDGDTAGVEIHLNIQDHSIYTNNTGSHAENDTISGFRQLEGGDGNDTLYGHAGGSTVWGGEGNDTLSGLTGHDYLDGEAGNDSLVGADDNDTLLGGTGADTIEGSDTIEGGAGADSLVGGAGIDLVSYAGDTAGVEIHLNIQDQSIYTYNIGSDAENDTISGIEGVEGGSGNDILYGTATHGLVLGGDGDDAVFGLTGNDFVDGQDGHDTVNGGAGADTMFGGNGIDLVSYAGDTAGVEIHLNVNDQTAYNTGNDAVGDYIFGFEGVLSFLGETFRGNRKSECGFDLFFLKCARSQTLAMVPACGHAGY